MPGHLQFRAFLYLMCLLYCAFHAKCICPDPLQMPRACHCFWKWLKTSQNPHVLPTFDKVQNPLCLPGETTSERPKVVRTSCPSHHNDLHFFDMSTSIQLPEVARSWCALRILTWKCASGHNACTFSTSQLPKMVRSWWVLYVLTLKCASRHNGVHFFDMSTSIQLPEVARSWCALRILTWKCASGHNACTFSTSQLPKMVRSWWVLYVLTLKCASRHNGVHFFDISAFKSVPRLTCFDFEMCFAPQWRAIVHLSSGLRWLRIRRFSEPTFQPSLATNHWKSTVFHAFSTFSRACILHLHSSDSFSSLLSSSLLFSDSSHLCFSMCP